MLNWQLLSNSTIPNHQIQIQIQIQKKFIATNTLIYICLQVYSDNEGNEADAYLSLYREWYQLITSVMAYSL